MGHGDEITLADANFPGCSCSNSVIRMDGHGILPILDAILQVFPLDTYVPYPLTLMQVPPENPVKTPIWDDYKNIVQRYDQRGANCFEEVERFTFYRRVQEQSFAVVMTGETALNANLILKKGVILDGGRTL